LFSTNVVTTRNRRIREKKKALNFFAFSKQELSCKLMLPAESSILREELFIPNIDKKFWSISDKP